MGEKSKSDQELQWLIAEFQELRKETDRRSKGQLLCITASIAALGAVFSLIAKDPGLYYPLLLLTPWLLVVFALVWLGNDHYTKLIGDYVKTTAERWVNSKVPAELTLGWEHYLARKRSKEAGKWLISISNIVFVFYFVGPAILCLVVYGLLALAPGVSLSVLPTIGLIFDVLLLVALGVVWKRMRQGPGEER